MGDRISKLLIQQYHRQALIILHGRLKVCRWTNRDDEEPASKPAAKPMKRSSRRPLGTPEAYLIIAITSKIII
jgi:hypothetical protein